MSNSKPNSTPNWIMSIISILAFFLSIFNFLGYKKEDLKQLFVDTVLESGNFLSYKVLDAYFDFDSYLIELNIQNEKSSYCNYTSTEFTEKDLLIKVAEKDGFPICKNLRIYESKHSLGEISDSEKLNGLRVRDTVDITFKAYRDVGFSENAINTEPWRDGYLYIKCELLIGKETKTNFLKVEDRIFRKPFSKVKNKEITLCATKN